MDLRRLLAASIKQGKTLRRVAFNISTTADLPAKAPKLTFDTPMAPLLPQIDSSAKLNDAEFLTVASHTAISLDADRFYFAFTSKVDELEKRTKLFAAPAFTDRRLAGWSVALCRTCGHFNGANKHFMLKTGRLFDDEALALRLIAMVRAGLEELDRRFERDIKSPEDWARCAVDKDAGVRRHLAYALNYIARYAYTFRHQKAFAEAALPLLKDRYDISAMFLNIAVIAFAQFSDPLYLHILKVVDECDDFLDPKSEPNYTCCADDFLQYSQRIEAILLTHVRNLTKLTRYDDVISLAERFDLSPAELVQRQIHGPFFTAILSRVQDLGPVIDAVSGLPRKNAIPKILQALLYARIGKLSKAQEVIASDIDISSLGLSELAKFSRAVDYILPARSQPGTITSIKERLVELSAASRYYGDENFMGRAVDIERQAQEAAVMKEYHSAVSRLFKLGLLSAAKGTERDQLAQGDSIVMLALIQDRVTPPILAPLFPILEKHGAKVFNLVHDGLSNKFVRPWKFSPRLTANFEALVGSPREKNALLHDWTLDPEKQEISCLGINLYQGFYERIARVLKVFEVDWSMPTAKSFLDLWVRQCDRLLCALEEAKAVAAPLGARITLVSLQGQFVPGYAMKLYAAANRDTFSHVTISSSYENWATNVGGKPLSTLTLLNNTAYPLPSAPSFGRGDDFSSWLETEFKPQRARHMEVVKQMTSLPRAGNPLPETEALLNRLANLRKGGAKIFCALGKITYDLAVPYQAGPAHSNMKDWINHTVETIRGTNNILLVKPHPHEINIDISQKANEMFCDLIQGDLPDNVIILPHRGVGVQDLMPYVSVFLCWNGSSIQELGAQGAKIVAGDVWAQHNYPVHVFLPADRRHYEQILRSEVSVEMHPEFQGLCEAYTAYMAASPFAFEYPYVGRSSTNTDFNRSWINWEHFTLEALSPLMERHDEIAGIFMPQKSNPVLWQRYEEGKIAYRPRSEAAA